VVDFLELLHRLGIVARHDHRLAVSLGQRSKNRGGGYLLFSAASLEKKRRE